MKNMKKIIFLVTLVSLIAFTSFCSKPGEVVVEKYFQAMSMKDKTTMSSMAIEPKELVYKSFKITVPEEISEMELELPALQAKLKKISDEKQKQGQKTEDAQYAIEDLKDEIAGSRRPTAEMKKKLEDAELAFTQEKQSYAQIVVRLNNIKKKIDREKELIGMSTGRTESLELFTGKTFYQKVDVSVTLENGEVKPYVFLLRRNDLNLEGSKPINGRFIITKILTSEEYEAYKQAEETQKAEDEALEEGVTEEKPAAEAEQPAAENPEEETTGQE